MPAQIENVNGAADGSPVRPPHQHHPLDPNVWSLAAYIAHTEAMRQADKDFNEERDRRYKEVAIEQAKALKIKETADLAALGLAREIQDYKEHQNNGKNALIQSERGTFATRDVVQALSDKFEVAHAPVLAYIASQRGRSGGFNSGWGYLLGAAGLASLVIGIVLGLAQ